MNLIPKICELLDVAIEEEFNLINTETKTLNITERTPTKYRLNNDCPTIIEYYIPAGDRWSRSTALFNILNGNLEIIKLPFEPKDGEKYWNVYWNEEQGICADWNLWHNTNDDYMYKYCGNCFRTEAEAEREKYNVYERLMGKKWGE